MAGLPSCRGSMRVLLSALPSVNVSFESRRTDPQDGEEGQDRADGAAYALDAAEQTRQPPSAGCSPVKAAAAPIPATAASPSTASAAETKPLLIPGYTYSLEGSKSAVRRSAYSTQSCAGFVAFLLMEMPRRSAAPLRHTPAAFAAFAAGSPAAVVRRQHVRFVLEHVLQYPPRFLLLTAAR